MSVTSFKIKVYEEYRKADMLKAIEPPPPAPSPSLQRNVSVRNSIKDILSSNNIKKGELQSKEPPL